MVFIYVFSFHGSKDFTEIINAFVLQTGFCWEMARAPRSLDV